MLKKTLYAAAVLLPLSFLGTAPAMADVSVGVGFGSPYYGYGYYPYHPYYDYGLYDPYGPNYGPYYNDRYDDEVVGDVEVIEPAAAPAAPTGCVKTNVNNLKNACPR
jgi:hypothetical protein